MNKKNCLIITLLFTITILSFFSSISAQNGIEVNIHIIGEKARTYLNNPVIVAGIWHFINVTLDDQEFQSLDLKFYKGSSLPAAGARNESNYYEWKYSGVWTDLKRYGGYSYINIDESKKNDKTYSFCVGVKDTLPEIIDYYENWTLEIYKDTDEIYSTNVILEKPMIGLAKGHDDKLNFRVDPFSSDEELFTYDDTYFTIGNTGNVPIDIVVDYGTYNDITIITNSGKKLSIQNTFDHYVTITSENWKPGILTINGDVLGTVPSNLIITTTMITFNTTLQTNAASLEISVGHSNCTIEQIAGSNIVFQYQKELKMRENEIKEITVYISGQGTVKLSVAGDEVNVAILKVIGEDQTGTPLTITSTDASEYAVTIQVQAIRENKVGIITYELEVDGITQTYETKITIDAPIASGEQTQEAIIPISTLVIILLVVVVIGYMIFSQIRHKRR